MGKWDVDFDDYEERSGYLGEQPTPGLYEGKLVKFEEHTTSDTALHWVFEITEDCEFKGWQGHTYSDLANAKWKTQQIVKAIQGGSEKKMVVNPDKSETLIKKAQPVMLRVKNEKYEGEVKGRLHLVLPMEGKSSKAKGKEPWDDDDDDE